MCSRLFTAHSRALQRDIDRLICKGLKKIRTRDFMFIELLDGGTKTPKVGHAFKAPCIVLQQDQHTVVIQHKERAGKVIVDGLHSPFASWCDIETALVSFSNTHSKHEIGRNTLLFSWNFGSLIHRWQSIWLSIELWFQIWGYVGTSQQRARRSSFQIFCSYA